MTPAGGSCPVPVRRWADAVGRSAGCFWLLALACVGAGKVGAGQGPHPWKGAPLEDMEALEWDHEPVSPWAERFRFDPPSHPALVALRETYGLAEKTAETGTDLERVLVLKDWVGTVLKFGEPTPEVFRDWRAIRLLEQARQGQRVWCGQVAIVLQQACVSLGIPARFVELGVPDNPACHFTTEVYLREFKKWAVVDATPLAGYNVYYTVNGVPQSALELHRHVVGDSLATVTSVRPGGERPAAADRSASQYYYVRWLTRNDVVTRTPPFVDMENTFDRWNDTVAWEDDRTLPWESQTETAWWTRNVRLSAWQVSDPDVLEWAPSERVQIDLREYRPFELICAHFRTGATDVAHLEVRIGDGEWNPLPENNLGGYTGDRLAWGRRRAAVRRRPGRHEIRVRIVRSDGTPGPESYVRWRQRGSGD